MPPRTRKTQVDDHPIPPDTNDLDGPPPVAPVDVPTGDGPHIGTTQMRQLHALLRNHGITTDTAVHDYLSLHLGREVTSRRTITAAEAARLIADLEKAPTNLTPAGLAALRAPFPAEAIGHLPRLTCKACRESGRKRCDQHQWVSNCGVCNGSHSSATMHITYVGHADVTARLLEVDPEWTWEPMATDPAGLPVFDRSGGLWINLTVLGVTRPGYGDSENGKGVKEAIGDALRNSAMRFGVALDLWAKGDRAWAWEAKDGAESMHPDQTPPSAPTQDRPAPTPAASVTLTAEDWTTDPDALALTAGLIADLENFAEQTGTTLAGITTKWREHHGNLHVDRLHTLAPMTLAPLVDSIAAYLKENPPTPPMAGDTDA